MTNHLGASDPKLLTIGSEPGGRINLEPIDGPTVAILMPVYNSQAYLAKAIQSIADQTYADFEALILDDGSTDSSPAIAEMFAHEDSRIRHVRLPHRGLVETLNAGLALTSAKYVARMDADDIALPERLARQVAYLDSHPNTGAIGTNAYVIDASGRRLGLSLTGPTTIDNFARLRDSNKPVTLCHPTVMFRKELVEGLGGYRQEYFPAEDLDLWNRIADISEVLCMTDILLEYRLHKNAVTAVAGQKSLAAARRIEHNMGLRRQGKPELSAEEFALLERSRPLLNRLHLGIETRSNYYYSSGLWMLASRQMSGAARLGAAFVLNPALISKLVSRLLRQQRYRPSSSVSTAAGLARLWPHRQRHAAH